MQRALSEATVEKQAEIRNKLEQLDQKIAAISASFDKMKEDDEGSFAVQEAVLRQQRQLELERHAH